MNTINEIIEMIKSRSNSLNNSGGIDPSTPYADLVIAIAALYDTADELKSRLNASAKRDLANLRNF